MLKQKTISYPISCSGIGVHSGCHTNLTFKPLPANSGIIFKRIDIKDTNNIIEANYKNVFDTTMSTNIANDAKVTVSTIEHLMSALWAYGIDNLLIEIDSSETPIMDGSANYFMFLIASAGIKELNSPKKTIKLKKDLCIKDNDASIELTACEDYIIDLTIDFNANIIGKQQFVFNATATDNIASNFKTKISTARTFGMLEEVEYLKSKGLARGGSLNNAIVVNNDKIMNSSKLRYQNEFVRHKILDTLGDLHLAGYNLNAKIKGYKSGHKLNNLILHKLFENTDNYEIV